MTNAPCTKLLFAGWMALAGAAGAGGAEIVRVRPGESLNAVCDRVRALPRTARSNGVEVVFAPGVYSPSARLVMGAADGGVSAERPVVWRAEKPGTVHFTTARTVPVSRFRPVDDPAVLKCLPPESHGDALVADVADLLPKDAKGDPILLLNNGFCTPARWPNAGEWTSFTGRVHVGTKVSNSWLCLADGAFAYPNPRAKRWDFKRGVKFYGYWSHDWAAEFAESHFYGALNGTNDVIRMSSLSHYGMNCGTWGRKERRFYAYDLLEELDAPREWWLDREKGKLYLVPENGGLKPTDVIRLASAEQPFLTARKIANLRFEGISLEDHNGPGLLLEGVTDLTIRNCSFLGIGGETTIGLRGSRCRVADCLFQHLAGRGIHLDGGSRKALVNSGNVIEGCRIFDVGVKYRTHHGMMDVAGCGHIIRNNEFAYAPHHAIRYETNETLIENNDIHHVLLETGDAGAIYTGRDCTTQGNVIRRNFIHELGSDGIENSTMAVYFDDCDCGDAVYDNVFWKCSRGIMLGGGRDHPIVGNVFAECGVGLSIDHRAYRWKSAYGNKPSIDGYQPDYMKRMRVTEEPWKSRYPHLARQLQEDPESPFYNPVASNVFINCTKDLLWLEGTLTNALIAKMSFADNLVYVTPGQKTWAKPDKRVARAFTVVTNAVDFGFADPLRGDFRLTPRSPIKAKLRNFDAHPGVTAKTAAAWASYLEPPRGYASFPRTVKRLGTCDGGAFTVEILSQANGPSTFQRVMVAVPKTLKGRAPCVIAPYYFPEGMLGFDPATRSNLVDYAAISYMTDLARRGYITISADAYHLTYCAGSTGSYADWKRAGEALARDWPTWTGSGKLTFDTRLLVDLAVADPRVDPTRIALIGHSLGGKMAYCAGMLDPRVKAVVASDFGLGWTQSNWGDVWYWGEKLGEARSRGLSNTDLFVLSGFKPFCLIAGQSDDADSELLLRAVMPADRPPTFRVIRHGTGHRPPRTATEEAYRFIDNVFGMDHSCRADICRQLDDWAFSPPPKQVEVRVRQTPGGPRLFVDGKRHLPWSVKLGFGGTLPKKFASVWTPHEIGFTARERLDRGMFLFRFEAKNSYGVSLPDGWVRLRNFRVVDEEGKDVFPPDTFADEKAFRENWWLPRNTEHLGRATVESNGVLRVDVLNSRPKDKDYGGTTRNSDFYLSTSYKNFKVRPGGRYRVRFEAMADHDQEFYPSAYQMPGFKTLGVEPDIFTETIRRAKDAGIDIVILMCQSPGCWLRTGEFSFKGIDLDVDRAIAANPDALVIVRYGVRPPNWLFDENPDWRMKFFDGKTQDDDSVSCLPWRSYSARFTDALIRHLMRRYPRNFAGVHIASHRAGEWLYEDMLCGKLGGADVHTLDAWRRYLAALGVPDAALAPIVTADEREAKPDGETLMDPVADWRHAEFNRFYSREMADRIAELASVARRASEGKKLVVFFYGYLFECSGRACECGHYALKYLLDKAAPDIDFLGGPFSYHDRRPPDTRPVMAPADTLAKYGVMWWNEDDTRTYVEKRPEALQEQGGVPCTKAESLVTMERNVRQSAIRNHGFWWVDLLQRGWFLDPDLWQAVGKVRPLGEERLASDVPFSPEVAMIVSEESAVYRRYDRSWAATWPIEQTQILIERAGVQAGQYVFEDVIDREIPARVRFYLNPTYLTTADRAKLRAQRAARPDLVRVWMWAPGYQDEKGKGVEKIRDAVGFTARKTTSKQYARVNPVFAVEAEPGDEVWDRYENGLPSVVARKLPGGGWEIFHAATRMKKEVLDRILALTK